MSTTTRTVTVTKRTREAKDEPKSAKRAKADPEAELEDEEVIVVTVPPCLKVMSEPPPLETVHSIVRVNFYIQSLATMGLEERALRFVRSDIVPLPEGTFSFSKLYALAVAVVGKAFESMPKPEPDIDALAKVALLSAVGFNVRLVSAFFFLFDLEKLQKDRITPGLLAFELVDLCHMAYKAECNDEYPSGATFLMTTKGDRNVMANVIKDFAVKHSLYNMALVKQALPLSLRAEEDFEDLGSEEEE